MNILVCCKVVAHEQDITINPDRTLNLSKASGKISQFDLNAIQAGVDIKTSLPNSKLIALSVGNEIANNPKIKKDLLSRGVDELNISKQDDNLLATDTAEVLSQMAKQIGFGLIICGDGSGDFYSSQVGMRVATKLDIAALSGVNKIISIDENKIVLTRELDDKVQELELDLPALICVSTDINEPTIPGMKAILAASKKPTNDISININPSCDVEILEIKAPKQKDRAGIITKGESYEQMDEFIQNIKNIIKDA